MTAYTKIRKTFSKTRFKFFQKFKKDPNRFLPISSQIENLLKCSKIPHKVDKANLT